MDASKFFPYPFRFDQKRILEKIYLLAQQGSTIFFHAPTGYGKTVVVLSALLPLALEWGVPIIWTVRTGNETDRPVEELKIISAHVDKSIYGISIRGKRDMCLLAREKGVLDSEGVSVLCERMKKKCRFFENLAIFRKTFRSPKTFSELLEFAMENRICPYYYQLRSASSATVVAASYNYVFSSRFRWALRSYVDFRDAILVVDEAHNLQTVMASVNSDRITIGTVDRAINELEVFRTKRSRELLDKIKKLRKVLIEEGKEIIGEDDIFDPVEILDRANIARGDFEAAWRFVSKIYTLKIAEGKTPRSSLRHLFSFFDTALKSKKYRGVAFLKYKEKNQYAFEVWDMRAAEALRKIWRIFSVKLLMSGTLKPFEAFAEISGIRRYRAITGIFPIPPQNILAFVLSGLTTKGEEIPESMVKKYNKALISLIKTIDRNMAIFFASYRIMNEIMKYLEKELRHLKRPIFIEREGMRGEEAKRILEELKTTRNAVLLANMVGRFAEGVDLPGEALEAIIIVGIPFERLTIRTTIYMDYYREIYGDEKGAFYSYVLPALRKASQAMGRAIRSPDDRAIIIAADERYWEKRNKELLPEFFKNNAKKTNLSDAIATIKDFLNKNSNRKRVPTEDIVG